MLFFPVLCILAQTQEDVSRSITYVTDPSQHLLRIYADPKVDVCANKTPVRLVVRDLARQSFSRVAFTSKRTDKRVSGTFINTSLNIVLDRMFARQGCSVTWSPPYLILDSTFELPSELVTLRYENSDIRDLLSIWAKQLNISYTVATDVQGVVSIDAKSALAFQTLSQLLEPLGATFTIEGGIVNIFKQAGVLPDLEQVVPLFRVTGESRFSALCRLTRIGNFSIEAEPGVSLGRAVRVDARGASVRMLLKQILGPDLAAEARKGYVSILQSNRAPQGGG